MSGHDLCGWYSDSCHTFHSNKKHRKVVAALWCALCVPQLINNWLLCIAHTHIHTGTKMQSAMTILI